MIKNDIILVTGGTGFIGSHLVDRLVSLGYNVRIFDNLSTSSIDSANKSSEICIGDLRNREDIQNAMRGVKTIFHCAALKSATESNRLYDTYYDVNVNGTKMLLEEAVKYGVDSVIFSSSAAVYGDTGVLKQSENQTVLAPSSFYGASKVMGEQLMSFFSQHCNIKTISLRYYNVYGPRQEYKDKFSPMISIFAHHLCNDLPIVFYGDGKQTRNFIYIDDVVEANILAMETKNTGEIYNIASKESIPIIDVFYTISEYLGMDRIQPMEVRYDEARPGEIKFSEADTTRATNLLGFNAKIDSTIGIKKYIDSCLDGLC